MRHLHDDDLHECYLANRDGEAVNAAAAGHLSTCTACCTRYREMTELLDEIHAEGAREADALFTAERLHQQRQHVGQRIDHLSRAARVITFPGRVSRHIAVASTRTAPRWLAAAAAAGLFVGLALGGLRGDPVARRSSAALAGSAARPTEPGLAPQPAADDVIDDDRFLIELELALERQGTRELRPFEALTPSAREISSQVR